MKRIALDGRYIADHFPGIGRYTYNLTRALAMLDLPGRLYVLYNPATVNSRYDLAELERSSMVELVATNALPLSLAEHWQIPQMLRQLGADLYHTPYYVRPYAALPCPTVTTLYDVIPHLFPAEVSLRARVLFDALTRLAARTSYRIITISASARADLLSAYRIDPGCIAVTLLAADQRFQPQLPTTIQQLRERYTLPKRYILSLASNKPHKNLSTLVEAFALLQQADVPTLVLAGHWDARFPEAQTHVTRLGLANNVRFLPNVADADLPALYAGAELFVYPSRYEGFGLPPLEAIAAGAPVLCGSHSSLPEVVGDAALLVDINIAEAVAAGMAQLLHDGWLRQTLRTRGFAQAARFTWRKTAEQTLHVYNECLRLL